MKTDQVPESKSESLPRPLSIMGMSLALALAQFSPLSSAAATIDVEREPDISGAALLQKLQVSGAADQPSNQVLKLREELVRARPPQLLIPPGQAINTSQYFDAEQGRFVAIKLPADLFSYHAEGLRAGSLGKMSLSGNLPTFSDPKSIGDIEPRGPMTVSGQVETTTFTSVTIDIERLFKDYGLVVAGVSYPEPEDVRFFPAPSAPFFKSVDGASDTVTLNLIPAATLEQLIGKAFGPTGAAPAIGQVGRWRNSKEAETYQKYISRFSDQDARLTEARKIFNQDGYAQQVLGITPLKTTSLVRETPGLSAGVVTFYVDESYGQVRVKLLPPNSIQVGFGMLEKHQLSQEEFAALMRKTLTGEKTPNRK